MEREVGVGGSGSYEYLGYDIPSVHSFIIYNIFGIRNTYTKYEFVEYYSISNV